MNVTPLTQTQLHRLGPVLDEEVECWRRDLFWDYGPSVDLIRRFVSSQSLPGFVLSDSSDVVGYTYYVINQPVGFIGDLFVKASHAGLSSYRVLLHRALAVLREIPVVSRIECQIFPFNTDVAPLFLEAGFEARKRYFLNRTVSGGDGAQLTDQGLGCAIRPWDRGFFDEGARVVYDSYLNSPDHELCFDYQSLEGCARFLRNLVDNPGCGDFFQEGSFVALDEEGRVCGLIVTTRISEHTGMVPQISVRRDWQGRGVGTGLMRLYFQKASQHALKRVTLSVSAENRGAYDLYRRLGFSQAKTFHAFVLKM